LSRSDCWESRSLRGNLTEIRSKDNFWIGLLRHRAFRFTSHGAHPRAGGEVESWKQR
jgi:hypothetical protein